ncbi:MAG: tyrosine-type recombinase/integrase, partial [Phycisphaerales bacterium]|nr:tyrosine-type recombinase/integrase [Phycisphaerales bacterium]
DVLERNQRLTRGGINRQTTIVLAALRWAKARNHMPAAAYASCASMERLKRGETGNRPERGRARRAVSLQDVERVAACAHPHVAAMLRVQALTGMRPGEVRTMRWQDIDKAAVVVDGVAMWTYRVAGAKTEHHGHSTTYPLPPAVQKILEAMPPVLPSAHIFRADREDFRGGRRPRPHWERDSYRSEVAAACRKANVPYFSPHEVRHGAITRAAELHGVLAAQRLANHSNPQTTARYLHADDQAAYKVAAAIG